MEKLLLPLGKGFAVIFIGIKGMHLSGSDQEKLPWLILTEPKMQVV